MQVGSIYGGPTLTVKHGSMSLHDIYVERTQASGLSRKSSTTCVSRACSDDLAAPFKRERGTDVRLSKGLRIPDKSAHGARILYRELYCCIVWSTPIDQSINAHDRVSPPPPFGVLKAPRAPCASLSNRASSSEQRQSDFSWASQVGCETTRA